MRGQSGSIKKSWSMATWSPAANRMTSRRSTQRGMRCSARHEKHCGHRAAVLLMLINPIQEGKGMPQQRFGSTPREVLVIGRATWYIEDKDRDAAIDALRTGID